MSVLNPNSYGLSQLPDNQALSALCANADALLFGDTKHSNPKVKAAVFGMLGDLKTQGFSKIWLEIDSKHQAALDQLLASKPSIDILEQWMPTKRNQRVFAEGMHRADSLGIAVGLIDDRREVNQFRAKHSEFDHIYDQIEAKKKEGIGSGEAYRSVMAALSPEQKADYDARYLEWKAIRDGANTGFAQHILNHQAAHPKQMAIVGDGHFNGSDDMNEILQAKGCRPCTIHVSEGLANYGEFLSLYIDQTPADGKKRHLPDAIYLLDQKRFAQPDHPKLMEAARKAYRSEHMEISFTQRGFEPAEPVQLWATR